MTMPLHEVTSLFPMMTGEEYQNLKADIARNGLREPIWTYQGKIVDGQNRDKSCQEIGREPEYREWDGVGSLVDFVVSLNLKRRHLTTSQKAMIAIEIEHQLSLEAEQRRLANLKQGLIFPDVRLTEHRENGKSSALAGKKVGIGKDAVIDAKNIVRQAPELRKEVLAGRLTLSEAKLVAKLPEKQRSEIMSKMASDERHSIKATWLEMKKAAIEAQAQASPVKPQIVQASWEQWLPQQPLCDLLLTDPPYSTDITDIKVFASTWLPAALAKVKETGRAYVCIGAYPQELQAYLNVVTPTHLQLYQILNWTYKNTLGPSPTLGYKQNWQAILYYVGRDAPPLDCPLLTEQFSAQEINAPDGRWGNRYHAWQKPDDLAERLVRHSTKPGDIVMDCFAGTGTFLLAAQRLGRVALGCDSSENMLKIAEKRGCSIAS